MSADPKSTYYDHGGIETIEILRAKLTSEQYQGYLLGNVLKYASRLNWKGASERDAEKLSLYAMWLHEELAPPPAERQEQVRERYDFSQLTLAARTTADTPGTPCCWTHAVAWQIQRFIVCEVCGNKRCPHATDCSLDCTGSNEPGQPGSRFADAPPDPAGQLGDYGACGVDAERPADGRPSIHNCPSGANCREDCGLEPCKREAT